MKAFFKHNNYFITLLVCFFSAEIFIGPWGNFPLNDDWAYAKAVMNLFEKHEINFGSFPSMTLFTHIIWGAIFTCFTGVNFVMLRISSIVSALIGMWILNKMVEEITESKKLAFVACFATLFNPMYFNLTNTFMTDVNFLTLWMLSSYLAYKTFTTKKTSYRMGFLISSVALVLIRQYGIILPISFLFASAFESKPRLKNLIWSAVILLVTVFILKLYEAYLKIHLPPSSEYKYSGNIDLLSLDFWHVFGNNLKNRYREIILHVLIYAAPIALLFLPALLRKATKRVTLLVALISLVACWLLHIAPGISSANIIQNLMIGPETFSETFNGNRHHYFADADKILEAIKFLLSVVTVFVTLLYLSTIFTNHRTSFDSRPFYAFMTFSMLGYTGMLILTPSYFDRYHLPLIFNFSIILFLLLRQFNASFFLASALLMMFAYFSVMGTKDYIQINTQRWKAYNYLKQELKVPIERINGGFEVNCWNDGHNSGWYDFQNVNNFDYVIQFNKPIGFNVYQTYSFQRYLPHRKDSLSIFVRQDFSRE